MPRVLVAYSRTLLCTLSLGIIFSFPTQSLAQSPTLNSISPAVLTPGGQATLTGTGFGAVQGSGGAHLQNEDNVPVVSWSDTQIVVTVPVGTIGGNAYVVQNGSGSNYAAFDMVAPTLTSISPTVLTPGGQATLTGTGFGAAEGNHGGVELQNNNNVPVVSWSDTQIVVTVPSGTISGTANVLQNGTWSNGVSFTIQSGPTLSAVSPPQGAVGAQVTLTGTGFGSSQGTNSITFNGTASTATYWTPTSITALVPSGSTSGDVLVTVGGTASNAEQFTVITPGVVSSASPASGTAGTQVTISGSGFGTAQASGTVWLGSTLAPVVSWGPTQIVATVSSGSSSGVAKVQQNGLWSNSLQFSVNNATIASISPTSGVEGTQVTIVGSGFGTAQGSGQVWLGTANGVVTSWSDGQVIATVASGSASGNAQILQNGVWSNAIGFNVNTPQISSVSPSAGAPGTSVTIYGNGFGSSQGSGTVTLGSINGLVSSWSDSRVVAQVASGSQNGTVQISQNGSSSNTLNFSVPTSGTTTNAHITPNLISMVVGDTRNLQVLDSNGAVIHGLTWTITDPTVASLSTDDPPILTALAAGKVTISAGDGSASLTVYPGPALSQGTIQWSDPGDGSGVVSIIPAVPSSTGVADVFALQSDGNVQAIASDGTVAWTASVGTDSTLLPDFQGGLVAVENQSSSQPQIQRFDGLTGQPYPPYQASPLPSKVLVHTDGTIFTAVTNSDSSVSIAGINPTTGTPRFGVSLESSTSSFSSDCPDSFGTGSGGTHSGSPTVGQGIIAGDGFAYFPYGFTVSSGSCVAGGGVQTFTNHYEVHSRMMRVGSDGSKLEITLGDWADDSTLTENSGCPAGECFASTGAIPSGGSVPLGTLVTNADQGVLYSWGTALCTPGGPQPSVCTPEFAITAIDANGNASTSPTAMGGYLNFGYSQAVSPVQPILQAQNGDFIGTLYDPQSGDSSIVNFDQSGNQKWGVAGDYQPQIATADGGLIATSQSGSAVTFDANGNSTGQMASLPTKGWLGDSYQQGSSNTIQSIMPVPVNPATTLWAFLGGNPSGKGTAADDVFRLGGPTTTKLTFNGTPRTSCLDPFGTIIDVTYYGYAECAWYTLLDHGNPPKPIKRAGIIINESFGIPKIGGGNFSISLQQGPGATLFGPALGKLLDNLVWGSKIQPIPAGYYYLVQQTQTLLKTGATVRVNCLDYEATDVSVTDVTNNPNPPCARQ